MVSLTGHPKNNRECWELNEDRSAKNIHDVSGAKSSTRMPTLNASLPHSPISNQLSSVETRVLVHKKALTRKTAWTVATIASDISGHSDKALQAKT